MYWNKMFLVLFFLFLTWLICLWSLTGHWPSWGSEVIYFEPSPCSLLDLLIDQLKHINWCGFCTNKMAHKTVRLVKGSYSFGIILLVEYGIVITMIQSILLSGWIKFKVADRNRKSCCIIYLECTESPCLVFVGGCDFFLNMDIHYLFLQGGGAAHLSFA